MGFKSFADRTSLHFGEGITIIVGPNGSGKSNVMDAIRWVLGEQSAKSLRGGKMEDVIFAGSDSRKTLGMAEVSLVMDNQENIAKIPYAEIKVTRRLYRSGESEYFINDNQVRLKDIVELFMDTGVGIDSYSIISQGEVERIISAKPIERREIFEEAAGITKYIKRRDEALRKLESTEQHMLRINDILAEVKRQASQLERQAKRAEKYKELRTECSDMEFKVYKKDIREMTLRYNGETRKKEETDRRIEEENAGLSKFELNLESMKLTSVMKEKAISEAREKWVIREQEIHRLEDSLRYLDEKKNELLSRAESLKKENVENAGRLEGLKMEASGGRARLEEKRAVIKAREEELGRLDISVTEYMAGFDAKKKEAEAKLPVIDGLSRAHADLRNKIVSAEADIRSIDANIERANRERKEARDRVSRIEAELERIAENRFMKEGEIKGIKEKEERLIKEKVRKKADLDVVESAHKGMAAVVNRLETRLNFLKGLHERLEGYGSLVRKILTEYRAQLDEHERENIAGAVGNIISVEKRFEAAVEQALRPALEAILVRDEKLIGEIFSLYELEKGSLSLLNGKEAGAKAAAAGPAGGRINHKNIIAYLPSVITVREGDEAVKALFHGTYIVESFEAAKEVMESVSHGAEYRLLTLKGEMISSYGIYSKGGAETAEGAGFLGREREIFEIEEELESAGAKLAAIGEEAAFREKKIGMVEAQIEELSISYHNQYVEVIKDSERIKQREEERAAEEDGLVTAEAALRAEISLREEKMADKLRVAEEAAGIMERLEGEKEALEQLKKETSSMETEYLFMKTGLDNKRMELLKLSGEFDIEANNLRMLEEKASEVGAAYERTHAEIEELNRRIAAAEEEKRACEGQISGNRELLAADEANLGALRRDFDIYKTEMDKLDTLIKSMSVVRDKLREEQYEIKLKINEFSLGIKALYDRLQQELKMSPSEEEIFSFEISEDEYKELNLKVSEYREKMDKLGVINLVAIEEYNELKSRNEFLQSQYDDLVTARDNLTKVIKKTNEESKELFVKAFTEIRARFAEVFVKMMNGGEADLLLTDNENILESGIDIIARPPGKRLQNINLLSGGEKAITAVSLLFALFLIKASPFCIMDEVDAALDDMNVARFVNLIKSFKRTQFLVISHNKITMETADVLYGISMEKAGVSKIMSVKLDKAKEAAAEDNGNSNG